jgi:hypothetical protein
MGEKITGEKLLLMMSCFLLLLIFSDSNYCLHIVTIIN